MTGERAALRTRAERVREAMIEAEAGGTPVTAPVEEAEGASSLAFDTASTRADAGAAWGALIHGLLEHAMRHREVARADLERLARWLTVEAPDLRPVVPDAIDVVEGVARAGFWSEAQAREHHVEVPFALLVPGGSALGATVAAASAASDLMGRAPSAPGTVPAPALRHVVRGVVDLAYRAESGWRIVDYKTDQVDETKTLVERHRAQLQAYATAWTQILGVQGTTAGVFGIRTGTMAWIEPPDASRP